jgi:hypothetical protein
MAGTQRAGRRENPFRVSGTVAGPHFTDREDELARITAALTEPGAKLLVAGERRIGKTSTLERAIAKVNAAGGAACMADLSTASTPVDMANRILTAAHRVVKRGWASALRDHLAQLKMSVTIKPDPVAGGVTVGFDVSARDADAQAQERSLGTVLDLLDELAGDRDMTLGLVLDEFQEVARFGEQAEWRLRGILQRHQHLSYVIAGSHVSLLDAMQGKGRAFYKLFERCPFGPIAANHMAQWIDARMRSVGLTPEGAGVRCVAVAAARTRDIVRLARKCVDRADGVSTIGPDAVDAAFGEILEDDEDSTQRWWTDLTVPQQNVLRAVAGASTGLTARVTQQQYGLRASTMTTVQALVADGVLRKTAHGSGYMFDDPFVRGWVVARALPDLGIVQPATFIASPTSEYESAVPAPPRGG